MLDAYDLPLGAQMSQHSAEIPRAGANVEDFGGGVECGEERGEGVPVHVRGGDGGIVADALGGVGVGVEGTEVGAVDGEEGIAETGGADDVGGEEVADQGGVGAGGAGPGHGGQVGEDGVEELYERNLEGAGWLEGWGVVRGGVSRCGGRNGRQCVYAAKPVGRGAV